MDNWYDDPYEDHYERQDPYTDPYNVRTRCDVCGNLEEQCVCIDYEEE